MTTARTVQTEAQAFALRNVVSYSMDIVDEARRVVERAERATRAVQNGLHVNSHGELQQSAVDFDRACALREAALDTCVMLGCDPQDIEDACKAPADIWFVPAGERLGPRS